MTRKVNGAASRQRRKIEQLVGRVCVAKVDNAQFSHVFQTDRLRQVAPGPTMQGALKQYPWRWRMIVIGLGIDNNGREYFKSESLLLPHAVTHDAMVSSYGEYQANWVHNNMNKDHLAGAAWVAVPSGQDMDVEQINTILTKLNAWG